MKITDLKNLQVDEFTSVDPVTVSPSIELIVVKDIMEKSKIRHLPVVENNVCVGLLSERSLFAYNNEQLQRMCVIDVMTKDPFTVRSSDLLKDVAFEMSSRRIGSAVVNDENDHLYGIFTSIDALNTIIEIL